MLRDLIPRTKENLSRLNFCPKFAAVIASPLEYHSGYSKLDGGVYGRYNVPDEAEDPIEIFTVESDPFVRLTVATEHRYGWLKHDEAGFFMETATEQGAKAIFWALPFEGPDEAESSDLDKAIGFEFKADAVSLWRSGRWDSEWLMNLGNKRQNKSE